MTSQSNQALQESDSTASGVRKLPLMCDTMCLRRFLAKQHRILRLVGHHIEAAYNEEIKGQEIEKVSAGDNPC